jgi:aryl-alcohol dehydrogenase-like predicted oxidoreductase
VELRPLGKTDLQVSPLCLGTMQFGWTADEPSSFATMDAYIEAGGNFLDTADIYSRWSSDHVGGESEEIIGGWLKAHSNREGLVIATKVRGRMWSGPDGEGLSRAHIERACEESLHRLQTETIDLYQCHWPDDDVAIDETLRAFEGLISGGKVRYIGASNYTADQLAQALRTAHAEGLPAFSSLQPHYNLVHRSEYEDALEASCAEEGIGVIPYSPLAAGFLTGKYRPGDANAKSWRSHNVRPYMTENGWRALETLEQIAAARGATPAAIALAWLLAKPTITAPIIGANTPEQLADLLPAIDLSLTVEEIKSLDAASVDL